METASTGIAIAPPQHTRMQLLLWAVHLYFFMNVRAKDRSSVHWQQKKGIWRFCNGQGQMAVLGIQPDGCYMRIKVHLHLLLKEVIWRFCNGQGQMAVLGMS